MFNELHFRLMYTKLVNVSVCIQRCVKSSGSFKSWSSCVAKLGIFLSFCCSNSHVPVCCANRTATWVKRTLSALRWWIPHLAIDWSMMKILGWALQMWLFCSSCCFWIPFFSQDSLWSAPGKDQSMPLGSECLLFVSPGGLRTSLTPSLRLH